MTIDGRSRKFDQPTGAAADTVPHRTIDAQRLRTILQRLAAGYYDGSRVRDRIAAAVEAEL